MAPLGSIRAPQCRGGGHVKEKVTRDWSIMMNVKERRFGLRSALASKVKGACCLAIIVLFVRAKWVEERGKAQYGPLSPFLHLGAPSSLLVPKQCDRDPHTAPPSSQVFEGRLLVFESLESTGRTKDVAAKCAALWPEGSDGKGKGRESLLLVDRGKEDPRGGVMLRRGALNIPGLEVLPQSVSSSQLYPCKGRSETVRGSGFPERLSGTPFPAIFPLSLTGPPSPVPPSAPLHRHHRGSPMGSRREAPAALPSPQVAAPAHRPLARAAPGGSGGAGPAAVQAAKGAAVDGGEGVGPGGEEVEGRGGGGEGGEGGVIMREGRPRAARPRSPSGSAAQLLLL